MIYGKLKELLRIAAALAVKKDTLNLMHSILRNGKKKKELSESELDDINDVVKKISSLPDININQYGPLLASWYKSKDIDDDFFVDSEKVEDMQRRLENHQKLSDKWKNKNRLKMPQDTLDAYSRSFSHSNWGLSHVSYNDFFDDIKVVDSYDRRGKTFDILKPLEPVHEFELDGQLHRIYIIKDRDQLNINSEANDFFRGDPNYCVFQKPQSGHKDYWLDKDAQPYYDIVRENHKSGSIEHAGLASSKKIFSDAEEVFRDDQNSGLMSESLLKEVMPIVVETLGPEEVEKQKNDLLEKTRNGLYYILSSRRKKEEGERTVTIDPGYFLFHYFGYEIPEDIKTFFRDNVNIDDQLSDSSGRMEHLDVFDEIGLTIDAKKINGIGDILIDMISEGKLKDNEKFLSRIGIDINNLQDYMTTKEITKSLYRKLQYSEFDKVKNFLDQTNSSFSRYIDDADVRNLVGGYCEYGFYSDVAMLSDKFDVDVSNSLDDKELTQILKYDLNYNLTKNIHVSDERFDQWLSSDEAETYFLNQFDESVKKLKNNSEYLYANPSNFNYLKKNAGLYIPDSKKSELIGYFYDLVKDQSFDMKNEINMQYFYDSGFLDKDEEKSKHMPDDYIDDNIDDNVLKRMMRLNLVDDSISKKNKDKLKSKMRDLIKKHSYTFNYQYNDLELDDIEPDKMSSILDDFVKEIQRNTNVFDDPDYNVIRRTYEKLYGSIEFKDFFDIKNEEIENYGDENWQEAIKDTMIKKPSILDQYKQFDLPLKQYKKAFNIKNIFETNMAYYLSPLNLDNIKRIEKFLNVDVNDFVDGNEIIYNSLLLMDDGKKLTVQQIKDVADYLKVDVSSLLDDYRLNYIMKKHARSANFDMINNIFEMVDVDDAQRNELFENIVSNVYASGKNPVMLTGKIKELADNLDIEDPKKYISEYDREIFDDSSDLLKEMIQNNMEEYFKHHHDKNNLPAEHSEYNVSKDPLYVYVYDDKHLNKPKLPHMEKTEGGWSNAEWLRGKRSQKMASERSDFIPTSGVGDKPFEGYKNKQTGEWISKEDYQHLGDHDVSGEIAEAITNKVNDESSSDLVMYHLFEPEEKPVYRGHEKFADLHGIDPENLQWLGKGDFGNAYSTGDGRVVKETSSQSEAQIAKELMGMTGPFAKIYDVKKNKGLYYILEDEVRTDSDIEDKFNMVDTILSSQGLSVQHINYFDEDEYDDEIDEDIKQFMNELDDINRVYLNLGIEASDIRPENLGYDRDGNLVAFDFEDRANKQYLNIEIDEF